MNTTHGVMRTRLRAGNVCAVADADDEGGTLAPAPATHNLGVACQLPLLNNFDWEAHGEAHDFGQVLCHGTAEARGAVLGGQHPLEAQQQVQVALWHHLLLQLL